jgi:hypothetical protein
MLAECADAMRQCLVLKAYPCRSCGFVHTGSLPRSIVRICRNPLAFRLS